MDSRGMRHNDGVRTAIESGDLGAIVRSLRQANHLTLAQLAARCGLLGVDIVADGTR